VPYPSDEDVVYEAQPRTSLPPYNGFGTHEDSSYNCKTIYPIAPVKDLKQFLQKDKCVRCTKHAVRIYLVLLLFLLFRPGSLAPGSHATGTHP
jgi:hypothetical protein